MKALHENIKNFRQLRKMTQKDFAAQLNKSRNVISNWERGTNAPANRAVLTAPYTIYYKHI